MRVGLRLGNNAPSLSVPTKKYVKIVGLTYWEPEYETICTDDWYSSVFNKTTTHGRVRISLLDARLSIPIIFSKNEIIEKDNR
jgi:hypothetical protein